MANATKLSVIMITGACRERAQYAIDSLDAQNIDERFEIIIADLAGETNPPFIPPKTQDYDYIVLPAATTWGEARREALPKASGDIIAFIEDHCFAEPDWAHNLLNAFSSGPWAAVGYSITNANPQTWISRAGLVSDYILWMAPVHDGESRLLPGNKVAYRSDVLMPLKDRLPNELSVDFNIHEHLLSNGHRLAMSANTLAKHQNYDNLGGLINANFYYCRMLAANRVKAQNWTFFRRWLYIIGVPLGAPLIKLLRILKSLKGRKPLWGSFVLALPIIMITFAVSAIGETLGYLLGAGNAAQDFNIWELYHQRTKNM